jgi:cell pole-organizing protein PopZ
VCFDVNNPSQDDVPAGQQPQAGDTDKPEADQQEPSMEDILTSIRRILSEEGGEETDEPQAEDAMTSPPEPVSPPGFDSPPEATSSPEPAAEITETEPGPVSTPEPEPEPEREVVLEDVESTPAESESDNVLVLTPQMRAPLVSPTAATASADVLNQLAKAILDRRDMAIGNRGVTLEGMVREMMRPLLKEWLDRNLPYLIERLVKKEIDLMINRAERLED